MAGTAGSTDISGTNITLNGSANKMLDPVNVIVFNTGDVVTQVSFYLQVATTEDWVCWVGLHTTNDFSVDGAHGSLLAWSKQITVPNGTPATAWYNIPISNEAITATNGDELAVSFATRSTGNLVIKGGVVGNLRSEETAGTTFGASWNETATVARLPSFTITTAAGGTVQSIIKIPQHGT